MVDPTNFTNPLGGHEVVADVLAQIRKKLATDCNLRATDGYSGGYSGEVTIKLRCHAVRVATVDMVIPISQSAEIQAPGPEAFLQENVVSVEIDEALSIPLEPNLKEVRSRTADNNAEVEEQNKSEAVIPKVGQRRKYLRHGAMAAAVSE